jgi:hypothetical protein
MPHLIMMAFVDMGLRKKNEDIRKKAPVNIAGAFC